MNRGFIPLLTALIIGVVSLVTAGGVYTVVKISSLEKENKRIAEELVEQKEVIVQGIVLDEISTTTEIVAAEAQTQEIKRAEIVEEKTKTIAKPSVTVPVESVIPVIPAFALDNTANEEAAKKLEEEKAVDLYLMTSLKAAGEITLAGTKRSEVLRVLGENPTIAQSYAIESLDLCSSAHEINLNNMPPKLSFWSEMYKLYELSTQESSLCKQIANIYIQVAKYQVNNNHAGASNAITEAISLQEKSVVLNNVILKQLIIVDKAKSSYFND